MSEPQTSTREDRFFGVSTTMSLPGDDDHKTDVEVSQDEIEIEIVDDLPKQPEKVAAKTEKAPVEDDDELAGYGEKVRKRIAKLKYEAHEAERQRESAERMREEAIRYAQQLAAKNQENENLIRRGEGALVSQIKSRASLALESAKAQYKNAYEAGDPDQIIDAQEKLLAAQTELREAEKHEQVLQSRQAPAPKAVQVQPQASQPQQTPPIPSEKALKWTERNPWFGPKGNRAMTALAYGVHETLIREDGVIPDTDEYYQKIDAAMRQRFPDYFGQSEEVEAPRQTAHRTTTVVAPATRNNGARPRKIQLTATAVSLAKRLGLTPEQYAKQLIKQGEF